MISERQLEDFICKNPEYSLWEGVEIIGRQVSLAHGRLDILAWDGSQTLVIELKARTIQEKDIGQVLRYRQDIEVELCRIGMREHPADVSLRPKLFNERWTEYHCLSAIGRYSLAPVLIGSGINSKAMTAARGAEAIVILWDYESVEDTLQFHCWRHTPFSLAGLPPRDKPYPWWVLALNKRIREACEGECWKVAYQRKLKEQDVLGKD